jgi:hypothetical protein
MILTCHGLRCLFSALGVGFKWAVQSMGLPGHGLDWACAAMGFLRPGWPVRGLDCAELGELGVCWDGLCLGCPWY